MGAHLRCSPSFYQPSKCGIHHRVIPRLLATCCLWQPERLQHVGRQTSGYVEVLGDLVFRDGVTRSRTEKAIGWTVVIAQLSQLRLAQLEPWDQPPGHRYQAAPVLSLSDCGTSACSNRMGNNRRRNTDR